MGLHRFWDPDFISVGIFWFGAPVFAPWAPKVQKGQILVFGTPFHFFSIFSQGPQILGMHEF